METTRSLKVPDFELRRSLFSEIYQRYAQPKTQRKAFLIMEAAIACVARKGYDAVTLEMVARTAGVTRPLIKYYFGSLASLLRTSTQYIRLLFQQMAVEALLGGANAEESLDRYVAACFTWTDRDRVNARVWFRFLLDGSRSKKGRSLNSEAVRRGEERIATLLEQGREEGVFAFEDAEIAAKMVQTMITGAVITYGCENLRDPANYARQVQHACKLLVKTHQRFETTEARVPIRD